MARPKRIESILEDESPIAPPADQGRQRADKPAIRTKMGYYADEDVAGRIRAAYARTRGLEPDGTLGDFQEGAVLKEVLRLERKYHDGAPWPSVDPGTLKGVTQMNGAGRNRRKQ